MFREENVRCVVAEARLVEGEKAKIARAVYRLE